MGTHIFSIASAIFLVLTFTLLLLILYGLFYALQSMEWAERKKRKILLVTIVGFAAWFVFTGILAANRFFANFNAIPPRLAILLLPPLMLIVILSFLRPFSQLLQKVPASWLLYVQSFRIVMEIILWMVFIDNIIPVQMTFEGRNYDILVGITAPVFAYFCFQKKVWTRSVAIAWNIFGLLLLANIVTIAILSAPVPFRVFMNEPANTFIAHLPFVWLPSFVVPVAYWMHIASLKQLLTKPEPNISPVKNYSLP